MWQVTDVAYAYVCVHVWWEVGTMGVKAANMPLQAADGLLELCLVVLAKACSTC